ncbi:hypothetical protein AURDEDRAFT_163048 [Auricularia subglabra TFB-10046 SS5]|nr:hypothetical protein AURDEDRAFT_163048 [Auricularia subglabra TFB-10046 SS5]
MDALSIVENALLLFNRDSPFSGYVVGRLYAADTEHGLPVMVPLRLPFAEATVENAMVEIWMRAELPDKIVYGSAAVEGPETLSLFREHSDELSPDMRPWNSAIYRASDFSCLVRGMILVLKHGPDGSVLHIEPDEESAVDLTVCNYLRGYPIDVVSD